MNKIIYRSYLYFLIVVLISSCKNSVPTSTAQPGDPSDPATVPATQLLPTSTSNPSTSLTPQAIPTPATYGPVNFPEGFNPLTGQPVSDPAQLDYPALLISISHFPPEARPQAGLSFSPFVYEYYITEGSTRHLAVFYGEFPEPEIPLYGSCTIRSEPMAQTNIVIGNRVWQDKNNNGIQDPREGGVGGVCINLLDENGNQIQQTTSDSNGYFGFNVEAGKYIIEVEKPAWANFTQKNIGEEANDSDVDQTSGRTDAFDVASSTLLFWDAGLVSLPNMTPTPDPSVKPPRPEVGPIRSGRIFYKYLGAMYQDSCLIYASADPDVLVHIPTCATVPHTAAGGGAMISLERLAKISEQNKLSHANFNYASNLFSDQPPTGGTPATELREYWALLNQSKWLYDAASGAWWRYTDRSDPQAAGIFEPTVDRLNGRQLQFENVILMFAPHIVITPTIVDIDLEQGSSGNAYLFRDGQMYPIKWSTFSTEYEQKTGKGQPLKFINRDGTPAALKPGHTWVIIFGTESYLKDLSSGVFQARFIAPAGAKVK
ncbi:MAG: SdrD B-like domain-containing protein [Anaerolineales bacterium]